MEQLFGTIKEDATVLVEDGTIHRIPKRGTDKLGYPEVLIDATEVGGYGTFSRQSIQPFIGMKVVFVRVDETAQGFNFKILK